ncbi:MAG: hypothetical protein IJM99_03200 [Firmicutes bacterium]|nr:hypothetical protein [Bacillota bacterium]
MDYVERTLGVKVTKREWAYVDRLPYYIADRYDIEKASIDSIDALFLYVKNELEKIKTLEAHITRIQSEEKIPVVFVIDKMTGYQRQALIKARIPFVVPEKQLYLPFVGISLRERFDRNVDAEQLQPAAQVLLYYYLYQKKQDLYTSEAVKDLGYTAMTISRATKQLVSTGFFREKKDGVQIVLSADLPREKLYEELRPLMIDPVRKKEYVLRKEIDDTFCLAGDGALAHYTMLSEPRYQRYAVNSKRSIQRFKNMIDMEEYVEVEFWKYDPGLFCRDHVVDPLSLIMSMSQERDERIEEAIEELLGIVWEE